MRGSRWLGVVYSSRNAVLDHYTFFFLCFATYVLFATLLLQHNLLGRRANPRGLLAVTMFKFNFSVRTETLITSIHTFSQQQDCAPYTSHNQDKPNWTKNN